MLLPIHSTRDQHTATLLAADRLLVGGGAFTSTPLPEIYDVRRNTWSEVPGQAMNRHAHTATLLADGRVLIGGGYNPQPTTSTWIYDPAGRTSPVSGTGPSTLAVAPVLAGLVLLLGLLVLRADDADPNASMAFPAGLR